MGFNLPYVNPNATSDIGLTDTGELGIAYVAFWVPAMLLSAYLCFKHGFGRSSAWFWIMLLGAARIIGNVFLIVYEEQSNPDQSLLTGSAVTGAVGISILLSAVEGLIVRCFEHMNREPLFNPKWVRLLYIAITLAVVLSILGGIKAESNIQDPTSHEYELGFKLLKAAIVILFVVFIILIGLIFLVIVNFRYIPGQERKLVYAAIVCMPFTLIRLIYAILAIFKNNYHFNLFVPYVWTEAFLSALPEFIVGIIIIAIGFVVPKWPKQGEYTGKDIEVQNYPQQYPQQAPYPPQQAYPPQQYPQQPQY